MELRTSGNLESPTDTTPFPWIALELPVLGFCHSNHAELFLTGFSHSASDPCYQRQLH
jgi:hypothetical protein